MCMHKRGRAPRHVPQLAHCRSYAVCPRPLGAPGAGGGDGKAYGLARPLNAMRSAVVPPAACGVRVVEERLREEVVGTHKRQPAVAVA